VFPHRRAITVVVVLLGQNENQPPRASEEDGGERDWNPLALEQKPRAGETGDRPSNNEAKERRRVHDVPDKRNVMLNDEGRAASRTPCAATARPTAELTASQLAALEADPGRSSTTSTGGWSASSSRMPSTRSVLPGRIGIESPWRQVSTVLLYVGGSAGEPSER
jgi:hypothetical protein